MDSSLSLVPLPTAGQRRQLTLRYREYTIYLTDLIWQATSKQLIGFWGTCPTRNLQDRAFAAVHEHLVSGGSVEVTAPVTRRRFSQEARDWRETTDLDTFYLASLYGRDLKRELKPLKAYGFVEGAIYDTRGWLSRTTITEFPMVVPAEWGPQERASHLHQQVELRTGISLHDSWAIALWDAMVTMRLLWSYSSLGRFVGYHVTADMRQLEGWLISAARERTLPLEALDA